MKKRMFPALAIAALLAFGVCVAEKGNPILLKGFTPNSFDEQYLLLDNAFPDVRILVNAPQNLDATKKVALVIYALPNGNTIEWTAGKQLTEGDDVHYDIQHVGAQVRFLRHNVPTYSWVVVYMQAGNRSWPMWSQARPDSSRLLVGRMVDSVTRLFADYQPVVMLNGHSGGGRFICEYIAGHDSIPSSVQRIAFIDSNYGYEDSLHRAKLVGWLERSTDTYLDVIAYRDSLVIFNGKPLVGQNGGTWYKSRKMYSDFTPYLHFDVQQDTCFLRYTALKGRVQFWLKENPTNQIYHTVLVERNGLIHSLLTGTEYDSKKYTFWGERAYGDYIYSSSY